MKKVFLLIIMAVALFGCSNDEDSTEVQIRISNASKFNFQNIIVNTSTGNVNFEDLSAGKITKYKTFGFAYHYAFVELQIEGKTYTLQPIDYVGETLLKEGNYTYEITANDSQQQHQKLSLKLITD